MRNRMTSTPWKPVCLAGILIVIAGCTTVPGGTDQARGPERPGYHVHGDGNQDGLGARTPEELLDAAEKALQAANEAQENEDHEAALRNYTLMLELLLEAEVEPDVFYDHRAELATFLDTGVKRAVRTLARQPIIMTVPGDEENRHAHLDAFPIQFPLHERILQEIDEIVSGYPKGFQKGLERSFLYLPYIRTELAQAGLPKELAWLAMVESQYNPRAYSPAGAAGMWQFMQGTGKNYGLRVDYFVDERFNWQKSTQAAIAYLKYLNAYFDGSWPLAVSAYNKGEYGLERAVNENGGQRDIWALFDVPPAADRLRLETKKFYPRLVASYIVASNPERYGFKATPQPALNVTRIPVQGPYLLSDLDVALGLSRGTLAQLNPDLRREMTPPDGTFHLAVPPNTASLFAGALTKVAKMKLDGDGVHTVRKGETLSHIASRYGMSVRTLMEVNKIVSANRLQAGQKLLVGSGNGNHSPSGDTAVAAATTSPSGRLWYTVKRGDSLGEIASQNKVSVRSLQAWNNMGNSTTIRVGKKLYLGPAGTSTASTYNATKNTMATNYTVRKGDYPGKIAKNQGVNLADLMRWNNLTVKSSINPGQKLVLYKGDTGDSNDTAADTPASVPSKEKVTHIVKNGQSPWTISRDYKIDMKDLFRWNSWKSTPILRVGDKVTLYR